MVTYKMYLLQQHDIQHPVVHYVFKPGDRKVMFLKARLIFYNLSIHFRVIVLEVWKLQLIFNVNVIKS